MKERNQGFNAPNLHLSLCHLSAWYAGNTGWTRADSVYPRARRSATWHRGRFHFVDWSRRWSKRLSNLLGKILLTYEQAPTWLSRKILPGNGLQKKKRRFPLPHYIALPSTHLCGPGQRLHRLRSRVFSSSILPRKASRRQRKLTLVFNGRLSSYQWKTNSSNTEKGLKLWCCYDLWSRWTLIAF